MRCQSMRGFFISIHAPPRGATLVDGAVNERIYISIHAPPRGATGVRVQRITKIKVISIHAPPRGATMAINSKARHDLFQFTPLREGRHAADALALR